MFHNFDDDDHVFISVPDVEAKIKIKLGIGQLRHVAPTISPQVRRESVINSLIVTLSLCPNFKRTL